MFYQSNEAAIKSDTMNTENNNTIALFMGLTQYFGTEEYPQTEKDGLFMINANEHITRRYVIQPPYNKDWNWLMTVVEKIESMGFWINIVHGYVTIGKILSEDHFIETKTQSCGENVKIESVYNSIVEFIDWHNKQQK